MDPMMMSMLMSGNDEESTSKTMQKMMMFKAMQQQQQPPAMEMPAQQQPPARPGFQPSYSTNAPGSQRALGGFRGTCFTCGKWGHTARDCPETARTTGQPQSLPGQPLKTPGLPSKEMEELEQLRAEKAAQQKIVEEAALVDRLADRLGPAYNTRRQSAGSMETSDAPGPPPPPPCAEPELYQKLFKAVSNELQKTVGNAVGQALANFAAELDLPGQLATNLDDARKITKEQVSALDKKVSKSFTKQEKAVEQIGKDVIELYHRVGNVTNKYEQLRGIADNETKALRKEVGELRKANEKSTSALTRVGTTLAYAVVEVNKLKKRSPGVKVTERGQDMQKDAVALRKSLSPPGRKKTKPTPSWASVVEQQQEEEAMAGTEAADDEFADETPMWEEDDDNEDGTNSEPSETDEEEAGAAALLRQFEDEGPLTMGDNDDGDEDDTNDPQPAKKKARGPAASVETPADALPQRAERRARRIM